MKVTLDTNCVIDLEENRPAAPFVKRLIELHNNRSINLRVVAISASERKPNGIYASNFAEFQQKIAAVGLEHIEILRPIAYLYVTFLDWCLAADDQMVQLERKIHEVLFPSINFDYGEYCKKYGLDPDNSGEIGQKWRRKKCDVQALWSHINAGGDIFVTSDEDFSKQTKKSQLIALGAGDILTPQETVVKLGALESQITDTPTDMSHN
jgi:hypothetical protein